MKRKKKKEKKKQKMFPSTSLAYPRRPSTSTMQEIAFGDS